MIITHMNRWMAHIIWYIIEMNVFSCKFLALNFSYFYNYTSIYQRYKFFRNLKWIFLYKTAVICEPLSTVSSGTYATSTDGETTTVTYECDVGYTMSGSSNAFCSSAGLWSTSEPTCGKKNKLYKLCKLRVVRNRALFVIMSPFEEKLWYCLKMLNGRSVVGGPLSFSAH